MSIRIALALAVLVAAGALGCRARGRGDLPAVRVRALRSSVEAKLRGDTLAFRLPVEIRNDDARPVYHDGCQPYAHLQPDYVSGAHGDLCAGAQDRRLEPGEVVADTAVVVLAVGPEARRLWDALRRRPAKFSVSYGLARQFLSPPGGLRGVVDAGLYESNWFELSAR